MNVGLLMQEHGANSLCAISKQQPAVKDYIAAKLQTLQPFELLTASMRTHCDNAALCKANAMALWSIAFKNTELKASAGKHGELDQAHVCPDASFITTLM